MSEIRGERGKVNGEVGSLYDRGGGMFLEMQEEEEVGGFPRRKRRGSESCGIDLQ